MISRVIERQADGVVRAHGNAAAAQPARIAPHRAAVHDLDRPEMAVHHALATPYTQNNI